MAAIQMSGEKPHQTRTMFEVLRQMGEQQVRSSGCASPPKISTAARANSSKVIMVDAGLPGSPKKNIRTPLTSASPNTSGWPGWMRTRSK